MPDAPKVVYGYMCDFHCYLLQIVRVPHQAHYVFHNEADFPVAAFLLQVRQVVVGGLLLCWAAISHQPQAIPSGPASR